jgi:hypothetical protein
MSEALIFHAFLDFFEILITAVALTVLQRFPVPGALRSASAKAGRLLASASPARGRSQGAASFMPASPSRLSRGHR